MVVGTYDGRVIFFSTEQLKYHTTIHVQSSRSKNSRGRKVTGIEAMPGEDRILITSTDSRIRLYDLRDLSLVCKYKGYTNVSSQIKACFSPDGRFITSGSENQCVYLWSTNHVPQVKIFFKKLSPFLNSFIPGFDSEKRSESLLRSYQGSQCCRHVFSVCSGSSPASGCCQGR